VGAGVALVVDEDALCVAVAAAPPPSVLDEPQATRAAMGRASRAAFTVGTSGVGVISGRNLGAAALHPGIPRAVTVPDDVVR
jgi:hypothetical protein